MKVLFIAAAMSVAAIAAAVIITMAYTPAIIEAHAEQNSTQSDAVYARANSRESYLCSSPSLSSGLFAVPYTYCVEILSDQGEWYSVKYAEDSGIYRAVYGYVLKEQFTVLETAPEVTYLYKSLTVKFAQQTEENGLPMISYTATVAFYGNYYSGAAGYSYVLFQGEYGYTQGAVEDYPLMTGQNTPTESDKTPTAKTGNAAKIIAGVSLGALALIALALILLSSKKSRRHEEDPFVSNRYN